MSHLVCRKKRPAVAMLCAVIAASGAAQAQAPRPALKVVPVLLPDNHNLQYLPFWVALGAGYFEAEGLDLHLTVSPDKDETKRLFKDHQAPVSVLPPSMYLPLMAEKEPIVLVANLLSNDPINVVIAKSILVERKLSSKMPLIQRLKGLKGLKVGVAPGPPRRLHALFQSVGLVAEDWIEIVTVPGDHQNQAFGERKVDGLYCHTPFLERALVEQGGTVLVNQSKGEVPALSQRQIHALVVTRNFLDSDPQAVRGLWKGIERAIALIHRDQAASVRALLHAMPEKDPKQLKVIVELYAPAVPKTPMLSTKGFSNALLLYPTGASPPDLTGIDLSSFIYHGPKG